MSKEPISLRFSFAQAAQGWIAGFADYPEGEEKFYELKSGIEPMPPDLGLPGNGFLLSGNNHSDDLFMFLKRRLGPAEGLVPRAEYRFRFFLEFASDAPTGGFGIGGAPGESVFLKAGASTIEPRAVNKDGFLRMDVDKGNQAQGGPAASTAGNIANGRPADEPWRYVLLRKEHEHRREHGEPYIIRADDEGTLWLLIGTDSGFEGPTTLFYREFRVELSPV
ncbi:MAG: hypothetical protein ABR874_18735 [Candidatus Sulfotelmatobacter sp.]|jgi:hypothetical protein